MGLDDLAERRVQFAAKPPPFGGVHPDHQRTICASCGGRIYRRVSSNLSSEWAHDDAFDDGDKRLCDVGYPHVMARPVEPDDPIP